MSTEFDTEPVTTTDTTETGGVPVAQQLLLVAGILLLVFGSTLTPRLISGIKNSKENTLTTASYTAIENTTPEEAPIDNIAPFTDMNLTADAVYVWDVQNQRALYKDDDTKKLPLASVTKLMTTLLAHELLPEDANVSISSAALSQDGDSGLLLNETFKRLTLSDYVLMTSSNDGAFALAETGGAVLAEDAVAAFVAAMNIRAKEIGLQDTDFANPTGLDIDTTTAGAYGTAKDMTFLMEHIITHTPEILAFTQKDDARIYSTGGEYHDANNTNYYIDEISGLIGSKTGYTDLAGGNLVIAYDAGLNRPIIISVLGSTQVGRFIDTLQLIEEVNAYLATN